MYYSLKAYWVTVQCEHIADSVNPLHWDRLEEISLILAMPKRSLTYETCILMEVFTWSWT